MKLFQISVKNARQIATELNIPGRSKMNKPELVEAIDASGVELEETRDQNGRATYTVKEAAPAEAPASDHAPDTAGLPAAFDYTETKPQRVYSVPTEGVRVEMERTRPGVALAEISTNEAGISRNAWVRREGKFWVLTDSYEAKPVRVKARSLNKLAKTWAHKLGLWADDIRVIREF